MEENILVIHLAFIGDLILATPALRALRAAYPKSRITLLVQPVAAPAAEMNPYVDEVLVYDKSGAQRGLYGMWRMARKLRQYRFTTVFCMNFAVRGAALAWLARIPRRIGYRAQHAEFFLTEAVLPIRDGQRHESENQFDILRPLHITAPNDTSLLLHIPEDAHRRLHAICAERGLSSSGQGRIVVCPFGRYAYKSLSIERASKLMQLLRENAEPILIGGKREADGLHAIAMQAGIPLTHVFGGDLSLAEAAALIERADVLVTVDTAPLHIAQAVHCPTIALFGSTDPHVWGPRGVYDIVLHADSAQTKAPQSEGLDIALEEITSAVQRIFATRR